MWLHGLWVWLAYSEVVDSYYSEYDHHQPIKEEDAAHFFEGGDEARHNQLGGVRGSGLGVQNSIALKILRTYRIMSL